MINARCLPWVQQGRWLSTPPCNAGLDGGQSDWGDGNGGAPDGLAEVAWEKDQSRTPLGQGHRGSLPITVLPSVRDTAMTDCKGSCWDPRTQGAGRDLGPTTVGTASLRAPSAPLSGE